MIHKIQKKYHLTKTFFIFDHFQGTKTKNDKEKGTLHFT